MVLASAASVHTAPLIFSSYRTPCVFLFLFALSLPCGVRVPGLLACLLGTVLSAIPKGQLDPKPLTARDPTPQGMRGVEVELRGPHFPNFPRIFLHNCIFPGHAFSQGMPPLPFCFVPPCMPPPPISAWCSLSSPPPSNFIPLQYSAPHFQTFEPIFFFPLPFSPCRLEVTAFICALSPALSLPGSFPLRSISGDTLDCPLNAAVFSHLLEGVQVSHRSFIHTWASQCMFQDH